MGGACDSGDQRNDPPKRRVGLRHCRSHFGRWGELRPSEQSGTELQMGARVGICNETGYRGIRALPPSSFQGRRNTNQKLEEPIGRPETRSHLGAWLIRPRFNPWSSGSPARAVEWESCGNHHSSARSAITWLLNHVRSLGSPPPYGDPSSSECSGTPTIPPP